MIVLFLINLLNFMDRFAIAGQNIRYTLKLNACLIDHFVFLGVLELVQEYFHVNDKQAGLLQTVFVCSYMALAPLFGYLG